MATIVYEQEWRHFHQEDRVVLERSLEQFLMDEGRYDCYNSLNYILAELAGNADKANLKRAHFDRSGLDLSNPEHYQRGMLLFKDAISTQYAALEEAMERRGAVIKVWFGLEEGTIVFRVYNNAPLLPIEEARYREKLKLAQKFKNIQEVMAYELDQSEGGGLGLIITVLMLRKINLDESHLKITSNADGTTALLLLPPLAEQGEDILSKSVVEAIDDIPQFPEHVLKILKILEDPAKSFAHIAPIVQQDPSLIAGLLKAANSSMYQLSRRIDTIEEAVGILGLPAIQQLLIAVTAEKLLMHRYQLPAVRQVMDHSIEVAWYCGEIAKAAKLTSTSIFVGAMLHDFGEIIINALVPGLTEKIAELCRAKGWNSFRAETLTDGYNHSLVGAALAKKWNFSDQLVEVIEFHHRPLEAPRRSQELSCLVYLGDFLWQRNRHQVKWEDLVPAIVEPLPQKTHGQWLKTFESILDKRKRI